MISATAWVRKGAAAVEPRRARISEKEYEEIMARTRLEIEEAETDAREARSGRTSATESASLATAEAIGDDLAKFNLDAYSEEEDVAMQALDAPAADFATDEEDDSASDEDPDDADDLRIRQSDSLVVACRTEDDISCLEVHVYEEDAENLYIHHDILLPSFPLAVEWLNTPLGNGTGGNLAAVATFEPEIEIWDLDVLEAPYPALVLGAYGEERRKLGKLRRKAASGAAVPPQAAYHVDAVMCLSWNTQHRSLIASGSADATVKLWDLGACAAAPGTGAAHSFGSLHSNKVQALQWAPGAASLLATASYDRTVRVVDCRTPDSASDGALWRLVADPEALRWNPHRGSGTTQLAVSDEDGRVLVLDVRRPGQPMQTLQAHAKAVTALDWNATLRDCLLTVSADRTVRVWHAPEASDAQCVAERSVAETAGKAFTGSFSPDRPHLAIVAGSKGRPVVLNLLQDESVRSSWPVTVSS